MCQRWGRSPASTSGKAKLTMQMRLLRQWLTQCVPLHSYISMACTGGRKPLGKSFPKSARTRTCRNSTTPLERWAAVEMSVDAVGQARCVHVPGPREVRLACTRRW